jgi:pyruvate kinase
MICTIGPSVAGFNNIVQLIQNGMDVARLNFSHGTHESHKIVIDDVKKAREHCNRPVGIMLDTKGPEVRTGHVKGDGIHVKAGSKLPLVKDVIEGTECGLSVRPPEVLDHLAIGTPVLIDNGYLQAKVVEKTPQGVVIQFENSGVILSSKGINIPGATIPLPALTEQDISDIQFGCEEGIDIIAASFIRNAENIFDIKRLLSRFKRPDVLVLAKIESAEGVRNFDSIVRAADGIMVARGDLGVEVPLSHVPRLQKMMTKKCNLLGKPVVTATQMLESMMNNPRPTRAEVSDVANAIYDGTSAVMLSGETAVGNYPQETVKMMQNIIIETEQDFDYQAFFQMHTSMTYHDAPSAITLAGVKTAYSLDAKAIFTFSHSGATARLLSRLKPKMPVVVLTTEISTFHQLSVCWGVIPVLCDRVYTSIDEAFRFASRWSQDAGVVGYGDLVVLITGFPFFVRGTSNTILVDSIGDVLLRGTRGFGERIHGPIMFVSKTTTVEQAKGAILVFSSFQEDQEDLLRHASGIILARSDISSEARILEACQREGTPVIIGVESPSTVLKEQQLVTIDPPKWIIYKGLVR